MSNAQPTHASVVIYYNENGKQYVLMGIESTFLSDKTTIRNIDDIIASQYIETDSKTDAIKFFTENCKEYSLNPKINGHESHPVKFDQLNKTVYGYSTNYRTYYTDSYGIIKGGRSDSEPIETTAIREVFEETGVNLNPKNLVSIASVTMGTKVSAIFAYQIQPNETAKFLSYNEGYRGELYDLQFVAIESFKDMNMKLNKLTIYSIKHFKDFKPVNGLFGKHKKFNRLNMRDAKTRSRSPSPSKGGGLKTQDRWKRFVFGKTLKRTKPNK